MTLDTNISLSRTQVHGLGGGSHKTWNISENAAQYWPKEWLPRERGFEHVRIYSYGYNSRWARKGQAVNIHDFGGALVMDICDYPASRKAPEVRIKYRPG